MRRALSFLVLLVVVAATLLVVPGAAGTRRRAFATDASRYVEGDEVVIRFTNRGTRAVEMATPWTIERAGTGDQVSFYEWSPEDLTVRPGETREWRWDQLEGGCYGSCQNVQPVEQAPAGRYVAVATINGKTRRDAFDLGAYFVVKFSHLDDEEFVVFAADQEDVDAMRAEAQAEDKTKLVAGVVRKGKPYNPDWKFVMGSRSLEIAEVAIEVCDGDPYYVQRHLRQWMGDVWCPWSSYVDREVE